MLSQKSLSVVFQLRKFSQNVGILGVPFCKGQPKSGVDLGPTVLRHSGLVADLQEYIPNLDIKDYGDVVYQHNPHLEIDTLKNWPHVVSCNKSISNNVKKIIEDNRICLTLGGDHSIGLGSVDGHARALDKEKLSLLWVDAHADLNTDKSTPTGNCHGMPVALLFEELRHFWSSVSGLEWQKPLLSLRNLAYIGLRAVDPFERSIIEKYGVTAFGMDDVQRYGIHNVIRMALNRIDPNSDRSLHVSFDIDSLDVLEAPSTGTAVRGGLTLREGIEIMETVFKTGRMRAMDLVEVNPNIGTVEDVKVTIDAAKHIIFAAFGHKRSGISLFDNIT